MAFAFLRRGELAVLFWTPVSHGSCAMIKIPGVAGATFAIGLFCSLFF